MTVGNLLVKNKSGLTGKNLTSVRQPLDLKQILELRGSKCTCRITTKMANNILVLVEESPDAKRLKCGNYCKHLTGLEQRAII